MQYSALFIDQCHTHALSKKLPAAVDGNKYRVPQLVSVQEVRDFGTLSHNGVSPSNSSPQGSGYTAKEEALKEY